MIHTRRAFLIAGVGLGLGAAATVRADIGAADRRYWRDYLRQIAGREQLAFFFEIPEEIRTWPTFGGGATGLRLLAASMKRVWRSCDGVQTFLPPKPGLAEADRATIAGWLDRLSAAERRALVNGDFGLGRVDVSVYEALLRQLSLTEPDLAIALMQCGDSVGLRVDLVPEILFTDSATGKTVVHDLGVGAKWRPIVVPETTSETARNERLETFADGPLDFGDGDVLRLSEILGRANAAFATRHTVDSERSARLYFVSRRFRKSSFEAVLAELARESHGESVARSVAKGDLLDAWRGELSSIPTDLSHLRERHQIKDGVETLDSGDVFAGKSTTVAELTKTRPGLAAELGRLGLPPKASVTPRAGLSLTFVANGAYSPSGPFPSAGLSTLARGALRLR